MEKRYITIFEDGTVQHWQGELPTELVVAADQGLYDIIDVTDPNEPMQYCDEGWTDVEKLSWQPA